MNLTRITIDPILSLEWILLLAFLACVMVVVQYRFLRKRLARGRSIVICVLRLAALSLLIAVFLNPVLTETWESRLLPSVAVIMDTSRTMALPGRSGSESRLKEGKAVLDGPSGLLASMSGKFNVKLYALGHSLTSMEPAELASLDSMQDAGDLDQALGRLGADHALAVVLSDGNLKWEGGSSAFPAFALSLGDPQAYRDVLIKAAKSPSIGFRGRELSIDLVVKAHGYSGVSVPVLLKEGNRLLAAKNVLIGKSPGEVAVSLSFVPEEIRIHDLSVSIPTQSGESLTANNRVDFPVKVVRDKIRILMVSGSPSLNYRFMRSALKKDPSVDLLSFVILRTPSDVMNVPLQEQSLIPFPVETLFSKELKNFDLVIFDNFPYNLYFAPSYLGSLKAFIKDGGAFAVIGGPAFSSEGGYHGLDMGEILPVTIDSNEGYRRRQEAGLRLSRAGRNHPVTRLSVRAGDNDRLWKEMPPLDGFNRLRPKGSGRVLLESAEPGSEPMLVVGTYGKGRVSVLGTDSSWKWYMGLVASGQGNLTYLRFMERLVRWLTKDPALDPVHILLPESAGGPGPTDVRIKMDDEAAGSDPNGGISFSVSGPGGIKVVSQLKKTGVPGEWLGSFRPEIRGIYKVKVDSASGTKEESLVVTEPGEGLDGAPDHDRLKRMSGPTGGQVFQSPEALLKAIDAYAEKGRRLTEQRRIAAWTSTYLFLVILLLLTTEWFMRRRWGLR